MRKHIKNEILLIFCTLYDAHKEIKKLIDKRDHENVEIILGDCQETAVQIGTVIEQSEGEGFVTVKHLEEYCEALYEVSQRIGDGYNGNKAQKALDKKLIAAENSVKSDIVIRLEVVFLPYKCAMFDSLWSIFTAADSDPLCDAYLIPIPYYDRNPDGSLGEFHYEGNEYPADLHITHYEAYDIAARKPDVIYIHNPYDDCNYVTSVDPRYYSRELKKYTDMLVYVPYFVMGENLYKGLCFNPAIINADRVIVQSEKSKKFHEKIYLENIPSADIKNKFLPLGSPKIDAVANASESKFFMLGEWKEIIERKIVVLYNTGVSGVLNGNMDELEKIKDTIRFFSSRDDIVLWWRPHPLFLTTIHSMRNALTRPYFDIVEEYKKNKTGIFDDTPDIHRAIFYSDIYLGDDSSVVYLFGVTGKPIVTQILKYSNSSVQKDRHIINTNCGEVADNKIYFPSNYTNDLYCASIENGTVEKVINISENQPYDYFLYIDMLRIGDTLWLIPCKADELAAYNIKDDTVRLIPLPEKYALLGYKFGNAQLSGNKIIMLPYLEMDILIYDTVTDKFETEGSFRTALAEKISNNDFFFDYGCCLADGVIYAPVLSSNQLLEIDIRSKKSAVQIFDNSENLLDIAYDGKLFWAVTKNEVLIWDKERGSITKLEGINDSPAEYLGINYLNGYIWITFSWSEKIIRVTPGELRVDTIVFSDKEQYVMHIKSEENSRIILYARNRDYYDSFFIINTDGEIQKNIAAFCMEEPETKIKDKRKNHFYLRPYDYLFTEDHTVNLLSIVDAFDKDELISIEQKQKFCGLFSNSDGSAGAAIHKTISSMI